MRGLSASECTGLPLSMIMARKRSGWSVRISSGIALQGIRPVMMRCPPTGETRLSLRAADQLAEVRAEIHRAGPAEVAGERVEELLEVGVQRAVRRHLDAEILDHGDAARPPDPARGRAHEIFVDPGARAVVGDVHGASASKRALPSPACAPGSRGRPGPPGPARRASPRARRRRCPGAPAGRSRPGRRSRCGADRSRSSSAPGPWRCRAG